MKKRYTIFIWIILLAICIFLSACTRTAQQDMPPKENSIQSKLLTKKDGLGSERILSLARYRNKIWIGTDDGLFIYDGKNIKRAEIRLPGSIIFTMYAGNFFGGDTLLIGGDDGIAKISDGKFISVRRIGMVKAVAVIDNFLFCGTNEGLKRFDGSIWKNYKARPARGGALTKDTSGLTNNRINALEVDNYRLWIGTKRGLNRFDHIRNYWEVFTGAERKYVGGSIATVPGNCGLCGNEVLCIRRVKDGIWFGTSRGASKLTGSTWTSFTADHREMNIKMGKTIFPVIPGNSGLVGNWVFAITSLNNLIFFGTNRGVSVYNGKKWLKFTYKNSKLPKNAKVNTLLITEKGLWAGTDKGLVFISKESFKF